MMVSRILTSLVAVSLWAPLSAAAAVKTKEVVYEHDGVKMKGLIAWDAAKPGKRPGILVVHEWWGHNDYIRMRAKKLARAGYTALAVDMYGDGKTAGHPDDAGKFASKVMSDIDLAKGRFLAAKMALSKHKTVNPKKIAAMGYCFGGSLVLTMARTGIDLVSVASFHGGLGLPPRAVEEVSPAVFVAHGGADKFIPKEQLLEFLGDMVEAETKLTFINYPGVLHGFTNPEATKYGKKFELPLAYNDDADDASWKAYKKFLKETFN